MTLLARVQAHTQSVCGLAWSPDGEQFATGGNDNLCCLFGVDQILGAGAVGEGNNGQVSPISTADASPSLPSPTDLTTSDTLATDAAYESEFLRASPSGPTTPAVKACLVSSALQTWRHLAAVKAIAFCPWRPHLLATGGGSNDKQIHFFHTTSGASLATISVSSQVTSLVWSSTRREIAATFGYVQPEHVVRVAVFSWPECKMIGSVKWEGEHRALYAVAYPGGPSGLSLTPSHLRNMTERDGCLIIASSDESVKFQEVWGTGNGKATTGLGPGMLGGSDIIEMGEGIDKEGGIIR